MQGATRFPRRIWLLTSALAVLAAVSCGDGKEPTGLEPATREATPIDGGTIVDPPDGVEKLSEHLYVSLANNYIGAEVWAYSTASRLSISVQGTVTTKGQNPGSLISAMAPAAVQIAASCNRTNTDFCSIPDQRPGSFCVAGGAGASASVVATFAATWDRLSTSNPVTGTDDCDAPPKPRCTDPAATNYLQTGDCVFPPPPPPPPPTNGGGDPNPGGGAPATPPPPPTVPGGSSPTCYTFWYSYDGGSTWYYAYSDCASE
jgi:hypothetical protein